MPSKLKPKDKVIKVKGETFTLMPEKTIFWKEEETLLVADVHVGKDTTFQKSGIAVPFSVTENILKKLQNAILRTESKRLLLLGDFLHAKLGLTESLVDKVASWRKEIESVEIVLVLGNHDKSSGGPPKSWQFKTCSSDLKEGPFTFTHHPRESAKEYIVCGHLHPAIRLYGKAKQSERVPCFYFGKHQAILPAFGDFTGTYLIDPSKEDQIFLPVDHTIIEYSE